MGWGGVEGGGGEGGDVMSALVQLPAIGEREREAFLCHCLVPVARCFIHFPFASFTTCTLIGGDVRARLEHGQRAAHPRGENDVAEPEFTQGKTPEQL